MFANVLQQSRYRLSAVPFSLGPQLFASAVKLCWGRIGSEIDRRACNRQRVTAAVLSR